MSIYTASPKNELPKNFLQKPICDGAIMEKLDPILSVKNLSISFTGDHPKKVISNFCLDLYPDKITALIGESGSGKSLISLAILDLISSKHAKIEGSINLRIQKLKIQYQKLKKKKNLMLIMQVK